MNFNAKWPDFASLDRSQVVAAGNRLLPFWVSLLLVIAIAWQLAKLAWMLVPAPSAGDVVDAPSGQLATAIQAGTTTDVLAIANAHLFGEADIEAPPQVLDTGPDVAEDTKLVNLTLKGTIASNEQGLSAAIIADGGNEEKVYVIGDTISARASLHAVYTDRVVLNENGRLTNLWLPAEFTASSQATMRRSTTTARRATDNARSIQTIVSQNVAKLADVIRPTPYFVNGQQQGYRVYPGRDRRQFSALGLRPGDLIKDIDGQSLTDPTQAMRIFQSLGNASQVSVTVERNGRPEVIVLNTSQLDFGGEQTQ
jgi:general secretion pathway protein C